MDYKQLAELVKQAQAGDKSALDRIYRETHDPLYYYACKIVGENDALDALQESYIKLITKLHTLDNPMKFMSWFKRIVFHECVNIQEKNGKYIPADDEDENNILNMLEEKDIDFLPADALINDEKKKIIHDAINALPDIQKQTLLMYYFYEMSVAEIAIATDSPVGTVTYRLKVCREKLQKALEKYRKDGILVLIPIPVFTRLLTQLLKRDAEKTKMSPEQSVEVIKKVAAATGIALAVGAGAASGTADIASKVTGSVGLGEKIARLPLVVKVAVGIAALILMIIVIVITSLISNNAPGDSDTSSTPVDGTGILTSDISTTTTEISETGTAITTYVNSGIAADITTSASDTYETGTEITTTDASETETTDATEMSESISSTTTTTTSITTTITSRTTTTTISTTPVPTTTTAAVTFTITFEIGDDEEYVPAHAGNIYTLNSRRKFYLQNAKSIKNGFLRIRNGK